MELITLVCFIVTVLSAIGTICCLSYVVWTGRTHSKHEAPFPTDASIQQRSDARSSYPPRT